MSHLKDMKNQRLLPIEMSKKDADMRNNISAPFHNLIMEKITFYIQDLECYSNVHLNSVQPFWVHVI